jgi:hypothetical protein
MVRFYAFGRRQTREKAHGLRGPMARVRDHDGLLPASSMALAIFLVFSIVFGRFLVEIPGGTPLRCDLFFDPSPQ